MKFEEIDVYISPEEKVLAKLRVKASTAVKQTALILGIILVALLLPFIYFIVAKLIGVFLLFAGIFALTYIIVVLMSISRYKKMEFVITSRFVYVPISSWLVVCPISEITVVNEEKIQAAKRKVDSLRLECENKRVIPVAGTQGPAFIQGAMENTLRKKGICLGPIENPESVIELIKSHSK